MSVRGVIAAFAVLGIVEASLVVPRVSQAGQLADTAAAATINGSMHSLNNTNIHAPDRARALARGVQEYRGYGGEAQSGGGRSDGNAVQSGPGRRAASTRGQSPVFEERSAVKGQSYSTEGTVVFDGAIGKARVVIIVRIDGPNKFQLLGYRPLDPNLPAFPDKAHVQVTGSYLGKIKEPQTGSLIHGFEKAVFSASSTPQGAPSEEQAQPKPEEKPTFDSVMKGWVFRGTAQVEGKATGVFVNDKRVKYAQAGDQLDEGIKVRSVGNGHVRVIVEDKRLDLMPW